MCNVACDEFFVMNLIIVILSKFRTKLLAANHSIIWRRNGSDNEQKPSKFLLDIMTLVSLANNIGYDTEFYSGGKLFIHFMNNRVHRINPWGTPRFNVLQSEKKLSCFRWIYCNLLSPISETGPEPICWYSSHSTEM